MSVYVLDRRGQSLMPCSEKRARLLLARGRARIHRVHPFAIRLVDRTVEESVLQPVALKVDPGSKGTGLAVVRVAEVVDADTGEVTTTHHVLTLMELHHRGARIVKSLGQRAAFRRRRRSKNLRYRPARFDNRTRKDGWLPPSLEHRVLGMETWTKRLMSLVPITQAHVETVRFDTQALQAAEEGLEKPEGADYQRGTLAGWELWEYLLERDGRACVYCGAEGTPLEKEHVVPRSKGGSNRPSNLVCSCRTCNERKGVLPVEEFLKNRPEVLKRVKARLRTPLSDAAAVNTTRKAVLWRLATLLSVNAWSGGRTKWNRVRLGIPKAHCLDAACVGPFDMVAGWCRPVLSVSCSGRGDHQRTRLDANGFPRGHLMRAKTAFGFRTGDLVRAQVPVGKKVGIYVGRVAIRATGSFNIQTLDGTVQGIGHKHCRVVQRGDGYGYAQRQLTACLQGGGH